MEKIYFNPKAIFTSPSIKYALNYADPVQYQAPDGVLYEVDCVLQLRQRPGSFHVHPETVKDKLPHEFKRSDRGKRNPMTCSYDANIFDNAVEWLTKEYVGISITGVLVRMRDRARELDEDPDGWAALPSLESDYEQEEEASSP